MSWTMRIGPSIQQFIVISKQHYLGYKQKFWKFFQDFRENHDEKDQRKEKSHWEYWYDSCLMNHVLWKHRIVGFRRSIDWFSDINHTSKSEFTKSLRVIVIHSSIHITCDLARLLYWILNVFRFRTKKTELDWFVVTGHLKMDSFPKVQ